MSSEIQTILAAVKSLHKRGVYPTPIQINKYLGRKGGLTKNERAARTAIMRDLKIRKRGRSNKGPDLERDVCRLLSEWWCPGRSDIFWRTHSSGARATTRQKAGKRTAGQYGDVAASDPIGAPLLRCLTFSIKSGYNRDTLHDLLDKPTGAATQEWEKWIAEIRKTAKAADSLYWAIIAKRDRREAIIVLPRAVKKSFELRFVLDFGPFLAMTLENFLGQTTPGLIHRLVN